MSQVDLTESPAFNLDLLINDEHPYNRPLLFRSSSNKGRCVRGCLYDTGMTFILVWISLQNEYSTGAAYHANNTEKYMEMEWTCPRMKVIRVSRTLVSRLGKKNDSISIWWWLECFLFLLFFFTTFGLSFLKMWKQYYWFSTLTCKITMESRVVKFTTIFSPSTVIPGQMFISEH